MPTPHILFILASYLALLPPLVAQTEPEGELLSPTSPQWQQENLGDTDSISEKQEPNISQWQQEILEHIDPERLEARQYAALLDMLDDLDWDNESRRLQKADTTGRRRRLYPQQKLTLSGGRCLSLQEGFRNPTPQRQAEGKAYLGDPWHTSLRYSFKVQTSHRREWRAGLNLDKDAGERWQTTPPWADSYHLYLSYTAPAGWLRQALVGHYRLDMGCGLVCSQGFSLGKGLLSTTFMQRRPSLQPHASLTEEGFMQGAALRLRPLPQVEVIPFVSVRRIDGAGRADTLTSWSNGGYHRTTSEEARRRAAWLLQVGTRAVWRTEWSSVGAQLLHSQLDHTYQRPLRRYNRHYFRGHQLTQGSIDYEARLLGLHLKGEAAVDDRGAWATLHGLQRPLWSEWQLLCLYRYYGDRYRQLSAQSVSESSALQGERGVSLSLNGALAPHWHLETEADWWRFTQPQYGIYQPSQGYELSSRIRYERERRSGQWQASLRYRLKAKYRNNTATEAETDITPYYRHTLHGRLLWHSSFGLQLVTQLQSRHFSEQSLGGMQNGYALSQAIAWRPEPPAILPAHGLHHLRLEVQGTWFRSDSYDCRLYLSESNLRYGFDIPMLEGEGIRFTALVAARLGRHLTLEAKYAGCSYRNVSQLSSGLTAIRGNRRDQLWLQLTLQ